MAAWTWTKTTKYLRSLLRGSFGHRCLAVSVIKFWILSTCQRISCWKGHEALTSRPGPPSLWGSLAHDGPHLAMPIRPTSVLCSHDLPQEASDPTVAGCVCMLVAPLSQWCDLGCCSQTVVVLKLRRTPAFALPWQQPMRPPRGRKLSLVQE